MPEHTHAPPTTTSSQPLRITAFLGAHVCLDQLFHFGGCHGAHGQEPPLARDGRRNQKLRTRRALVDAAAELPREGHPVTIADAAEAARVSTATAYRYFSSPQEPLRETRTLMRAPDLTADLPADPAGRVDAIVSRVADMQLTNEPAWRAMPSASLERSLKQGDDGPEDEFPVRSRNRLDLTRTALAPLAPSPPRPLAPSPPRPLAPSPPRRDPPTHRTPPADHGAHPGLRRRVPGLDPRRLRT
ncbi:TetR/AcrR family transcriptional regulator [Streptomyces sp. NPDC007901]|uniref:TetR/AcrR family transcriptional regulator n=1 Tax=Streptomyces sp. NPDC007901 TaxID=3364785 RepID=UPI0036E9EED6